MSNSPTIVGFIANKLLCQQLQVASTALKLQLQLYDRAAALQTGEERKPEAPFRPGEQLQGDSGALFATMAKAQPILIFFDLDNDQVPAQRWISMLKSSPATRRLRTLAFAKEIDAERRTELRSAGANIILLHDEIDGSMQAVIEKHAKLPNLGAIASACEGEIDQGALAGIALFNEKQFYKAHDSLEEAWKQDTTPARELYRAILQVAISCYQIERGNYNGALKMMLRVKQWLHPLPDRCRGVNVAQIKHDANAIHAHLLDIGPENLASFDWSLIHPIEL